MNDTINITSSAQAKIIELITQRAQSNLKLRITVSGGGCSGFQYNFKLDDAINEDDIIVGTTAAQVIIDQISLNLLTGSVLDYKESLMGAAFVMTNPNAVISCGCGNSFSI